jgi:uracil-DNA glycosylase family 4
VVIKRKEVSGDHFVRSGPCDIESGCLWCPLAPFHHDFETFRSRYQRDADKIVAREKEPHTIHHRNVSEWPWRPCDLLFVGEAPGYEEDKHGRPFVGRSGSLLQKTIEAVFGKTPAFTVARTNLVRCRPPLNKDPGKTQVRACSPELVREISIRKPKLIVALGNHSLEFLTGQTGITSLHGSVLKGKVDDIPVLACLHPAFILRFDHMLDKFVGALETARSVLDGSYVERPGLGTYHVLTELQEVEDLFKAFDEAKRPVAFDTETGSLSPLQSKFPRLLCFSFANEAGVAYVVPFDHAESPWRMGGPKEHKRLALIAVLRTFFLTPGWVHIAQNEKFDRQHIEPALGITMPLIDRDTMCTHLVINEQRGTHGLDKLAHSLTGMGGYDKELEDYKSTHIEADPKRGGSYANIPGRILFKYAGADADCTWRSDEAMLKDPEYVNNPRLRKIAELYLPKLSACLADLETAGAQINPEMVAHLDVTLTQEMAEVSEQIAQVPTVVQFSEEMRRKNPNFEFNPGSFQQLQTILFDYYKLKPVEPTPAGFSILAARHKRITEDFNAAQEAAQALAKKNRTLQPIPKAPPSFGTVLNHAIHKREWHLFTTKADTLHEYERQGNDLAKLILDYRGAQVLHSTFVDPLRHRLDPFGRVHGSFLVHGTVTGRLSSQEPNLQNIPNKGGGTIKQCYVSRFGDRGLLVNVDFSQIELRIAACRFSDPKMKEVYRSGGDLHKLTACIISRLTMPQFEALPAKTKDGKGRSDWRNRAKRVNFGSIYGGGPPALQATLKKDGIFIELEECKEFISSFFDGYPGLRKGMDILEKDVKRLGYLESFTGRRRRVPEVTSEDPKLVARAIRQCINFPIQSAAGDMTLIAMILINRAMKEAKMESKCILTVHDSLVFDCVVDEFLQVASLAKSIMENLPSLSHEVLPGLDWTWLDVPIIAECDAGPNWGQMVELDPDTVRAGKEPEAPLFGTDEKGKTITLRKPASVDELWRCFEHKLGAA